MENTFFTGKVKHDTLAGLRPYYAAIRSAAALVTGHHEKQNFLKTIYENFYKVYDKKKADRLGVVHTPNEIVRFMIESAFSFGVVTNRDEWVYSESVEHLERKIRSLISTYSNDRKRLQVIRDRKERAELLDKSIKWTRAVKRDLENNVSYHFSRQMATEALYRPFIKKFLYFSPELNEMQNRMADFYGFTANRKTLSLVFSDPTSQKPFVTFATDVCRDMHLVARHQGA